MPRRKPKHVESDDDSDVEGEPTDGGKAHCYNCGSHGHATKSCPTKKAKHKAGQKCFLCGKRGHTRRECQGIGDDGAGQSKYKGKYSKRPVSKDDSRKVKEVAPLWAGRGSTEVWVDMLSEPAALLASSKMASLQLYTDSVKDEMPLHPDQLAVVYVFNSDEVLLPEAASPYYRIWEQCDLECDKLLPLLPHKAHEAEKEDEEDDDGDDTADVQATPSADASTSECANVPQASLSFGLSSAHADLWNDVVAERVKDYLSTPGARFVGVVGLDFESCAAGSQARKAQVCALLAQLEIAKAEKKAVILELIDGQDDEAAFLAADAVLERSLPKDWPIFLSCFVGSMDHLAKWMNKFSCMYVLCDGRMTFGKHIEAAKRLLAEVSRDRILVATSSPHHRPATLAQRPRQGTSWSHSGLVVEIARVLARHLELQFDEVVETIAQNQRSAWHAIMQLTQEQCSTAKSVDALAEALADV